MHAEHNAVADGNTLPEAADEAHEEESPGTRRCTHSITDVLFPATPPEPVNARVIRRFDLDAARKDPGPAAAPEAKQAQSERRNRRRASRQLRNSSLRAAAGLT